MPRRRPALVLIALYTLSAAAIAQQAGADRPDPVALVSQAEKLLQKKDKEVEDAILLLWRALDELATQPENPVQTATTLSARFLLQENDKLEAERRRVFASVARQQVELATSYRTKKWLDVAATRLEVADRYDNTIGAKEHAALDAARPKPKADASAPAASKPAAPKLAPLLQKTNTSRVFGPWREVEDSLEGPAWAGTETQIHEWVPDALHGDHEIVVEWKATEPDKQHHGGIWIGYDESGDLDDHVGYRVIFHRDPGRSELGLEVVDYGRKRNKSLGNSLVKATPGADGFHRFAVRIAGARVTVHLDNAPPLEVTARGPVRGRTGVLCGVYSLPSCAVRFRNLRIDPLPADLPSDAELRAKTETKNRDAVTKAVDEGRALLTKKQPEAASLRLREALSRIDEMPAGVLRDNLRKTIEPLLLQADPLAPKRKKTSQAVAAELGALADQYATAGMPRAALDLAVDAAGFDPESRAAHVTAMREKVQQWNIAQATARANELAPPADDGTVLREWFVNGSPFARGSVPLVVEGEVARAEVLPVDSFVAWRSQPKAPKVGKASVFVHPTTDNVGTGLCFDIVDTTDYGIVMLHRTARGDLRLVVYRWVAGTWTKLAERGIALDAWRLDGWFKLEMESTDAGLVARCSGAEIKLPRTQLGKATGAVGLFASNGHTDAARIELRAFQASP